MKRIIDAHTHIYPDKIAASTVEKLSSEAGFIPVYDGSADGLRNSTDTNGIDLSIVLPVATNPLKVEHMNDFATGINEEKRSIISLGAMHPDYPNPRKELKRISEHGIKGIKIHPVYQGVDIDDIRYLRIFDICGELGLTVASHTGYDIGFPGHKRCLPDQILNALCQVGDFTVVLAHMGSWNDWDEALDKLSETKAYLDTSFSLGSYRYTNTPNRLPEITDAYGLQGEFINQSQFLRFIDKFGIDRILFGSDSPWISPICGINFINSLPVSDGDKQKIFCENAKRVYGL